MLKDKDCSKSPRTEYNLRYSIQSTVFCSFIYMQRTVHFLCVTHIRNPKEPCLKHSWITLSRMHCWLVLTAVHLTETYGPWLTANWNCGRKWQTTLHG